MKLSPYIHFGGNAEEALSFYAEALGGKVISIQRFAEAPMPCDEDYKQKIMHARLEFYDNILMISDVFKGQPVSTEGNVSMSIEVEDGEQIKTLFDNMVKGGSVMMPLEDTFWGARFGMLKDKFGVHWMFNHQLKPNPEQE